MLWLLQIPFDDYYGGIRKSHSFWCEQQFG